jgi:alpha-L-arabinofuranosidase
MVEYMHGGADTTLGAMRMQADGHPAPYAVKWFELGNEEYNSDFTAQVEAMEARAVSLGLTGDKALHYIWGGPPSSFHRPGAYGPNATDAEKVRLSSVWF